MVQPDEKYKMRGKKTVERYPNSPRHAMCNRCLYVRYTRPSADKKTRAIQDFKTASGCVDCGYALHAGALEFDHRPGTEKTFTVMEKVGSYSMPKIWAEIAKCDVVCANCHAIRTTGRRKLAEPSPSSTEDMSLGSSELKQCTSCKVFKPEGSYKLRRTGRATGSSRETRHGMCHQCLYVRYWRPKVQRRTQLVHEYKLGRGCVDCGYAEHPAALEFDHLPGHEKQFNVMAKIGVYAMDRVWAEVAKCEVVCANCHAVRTFARRTPVEIAGAAAPLSVGDGASEQP